MSGPFGAGALQYFSGDAGFYNFEPTGSLRFEDADGAYLTRTNSSAGNRRTWTFSAWVKLGDFSASEQNYIFGATTDNYNVNWAIFFFGSDSDGNNELTFYSYTSTQQYQIHTKEAFNDPSAWYHLVLAFDTTQSTAADRIKLYINGSQITSFDTAAYPSLNYEDGYINNNIQQDIGRAATDAKGYDGYMAEINFIDGTALDPTSFGLTKADIWTPKVYSGSYGTNGFYLPFNSTVTATGQSTVLYTGTGAGRSVQGFGYKPDFVWYKNRETTNAHIIEDRVRGPGTYLVPDNTTVEGIAGNVLQAFTNDGYYYGTNGAGNNSGDGIVAWAWDAGADQTATGYGCITYMGSGTIRPVTDIGFSPDLIWIKERTGTANHRLFDSVRGPGKNVISNSDSTEGTDSNTQVSFINDGFTLGSNAQVNDNGINFVAWCWDAGDSAPATNNNGSVPSTVKASTANGFSIVTHENGSGTRTVGHGLNSAPELIIEKKIDATGDWLAQTTVIDGSNDYLRLNTTAAKADGAGASPTATVYSPNVGGGADCLAYCFHSVTGYSKIGVYTGNGSATGPTVTCGFRPAFVMIKRADSTGNWYIFDVNRDPDNKGQRYLRPNSDAAEGGSGTGQEYIDFQSNGFQIIANSSAFSEGNTSAGTYLYMAFAGGKDTIAPVNTNGSITSRVKASDDTGFSIVEYEGNGSAGATVGHGLSSAPDWIVVKNRSLATNWTVYHSANTANPETDYLSLNLSDGTNDSNQTWNDTAPTSSVFSVGAGNPVNRSGDMLIAYCWTATTGKSAFGSFTGNGSSSGPVVTGLGFKPGFLLLKNSTDDNTNWIILDNKRDPDASDVDTYLKADATSAEVTDNADISVLVGSDGFTLKTAGNDINGSGDTILYMAFADGQSFSNFADSSGNNNNFTPTGLQNYDVVPDTPANNWCTLNPLASLGTQSEGNLKTVTVGTGSGIAVGSMGQSSGKWYWEVLISTSSTADMIGVVDETFDSVNSGSYVGYLLSGGKDSVGYYGANGKKYINSTASDYSNVTFTTGDIISVALNLDDDEITFYKNGVSQGAISYTFSGGNILPAVCDATNTSSAIGTFILNFGQDSSFAGTKTPQGNTDANEIGDFYFSPPSNFLALCSANLPDPTIDPNKGETPDQFFNTVLYTGDGASSRTITGVGFDPDFVWHKNRTSAIGHFLIDRVRGAGNNLGSDSNAGDFGGGTNGAMNSVETDGASILAGSSSSSNVNTNGYAYVLWNWLAGGSPSTNVDGDIQSSVSANTKAGFSIVTWTGNGSASDTVGHGLGAKPDLAIYKRRDSTSDWYAIFDVLDGSFDRLKLNDTSVLANAVGYGTMLDTNTISQFGWTVGTSVLAYCFRSIDGYSKIGVYTGNGASTDGTFVYTGFRPAWVLIKTTSAASQNWIIFDNKRLGYNRGNRYLLPSAANAESTNNLLNIFSNGFKLKTNGNGFNGNGQTYFYVAFADQPFKYANAR